MNGFPEHCLWSSEQLPQGLTVLSQCAGLPVPTRTLTPVTAPMHEWITLAARQLNLEAEPVEQSYRELATWLSQTRPLILCREEKFILVAHRQHSSYQLLSTDLKLVSIAATTLIDELTALALAPFQAEVESLLTHIPPHRHHQARQAILSQRFAAHPVCRGWHIRLPPHAPLWQQARQLQIRSLVGGLLVLYVLEQLLFVLAWIVIGQAALRGHLETSWLAAWGLLLFSQEWVRLAAIRVQSTLQANGNTLLLWRLLHGALQLEPDEIRHQGLGQHLGRVLEAENLDMLLRIAGGVRFLQGLVELAIALIVLLVTAWLHGGLLMGWLVVIIWLTWRYLQHKLVWSNNKRDMTHDLVEKLLGYRTRLIQEHPLHWHEQEDEVLVRYLELTRHKDQWEIMLLRLMERGWLLISLAGFIPLFIKGSLAVEALAISLGGVLLAMRALQKVIPGLMSLVEAWTSWQQALPLLHASTRYDSAGHPLPATSPSVVLEVDDLAFGYPRHPVLDHLSLTIHTGERILLEGVSGSGKTTLGALLAGLRSTSQGQLKLYGQPLAESDLASWRKRVILVPQFHENHVFTETFLFNLLMGRGYPPTQADYNDALAICEELGLGDLISKMPAGMFQIVGETGWQLSHGERSRLFIARALLQAADLIILDESLAALDPENMDNVIACIQRRAKTLLVIAHP